MTPLEVQAGLKQAAPRILFYGNRRKVPVYLHWREMTNGLDILRLPVHLRHHRCMA
jgi:hypothetical protein